jgi:hypothetical protein
MRSVEYLLCKDVAENAPQYLQQSKNAVYYNTLSYLDDPEKHQSLAIRPTHTGPEIDFIGMVAQVVVGPQTTRILADNVVYTFRQESPEHREDIINYLRTCQSHILPEHPDSDQRYSYQNMLERLVENHNQLNNPLPFPGS